MKRFKKLSLIGLFALFAFGTSVNTYAGDPFWKWVEKVINQGNDGPSSGGNTVGAPIDGGLLTILGAAGAGYFFYRRKNNKKEE